MAFGFNQNNFRFRADDGDLTTATWLAAENGQITLSDADIGQPIRLRISLSAESFWEAKDVALFYSTSKETGYTLIDNDPDKAFMLTSSAFVADNTPITGGLLANPNGGSFTQGLFLSETDRSFLDPGDSYTELEFSFTPTENTVNATYYIRVQHFSIGQIQGTYNNDITLVFESSRNAFAGGNGTYEQPYEVENWFHLNQIRNFMSASFVQTANIGADTEGYNELVADTDGNLANDGLGWVAIGFFEDEFMGTYDGGENYTISDLRLNQEENINTGFFSRVTGTVTNVGLVNAEVRGVASTGGIVGRLEPSGVLSNSFFTGIVQGSNTTGGLVAISDGTILNSYTNASIEGRQRTGGLVGHGTGTSSIIASYSSGVVTGTHEAGGLVGYNRGLVRNSYSTANVIAPGSEYIGGLIGYNLSSQVENSYATGRVYVGREPFLVGGMIGSNQGDAPVNSYWNTETTSWTTSSNGGTGLTTEQMMVQNSFENWDFSEIWAIDAGSSYPYLIENNRMPLPGPLPEFTQEFDGTAGWRFVSAPTRHNIYADFLGTIWTQGYPGSSSNILNPFLTTQPNVFWYSEEQGEWVAPGHAGNIVGSSRNVDLGYAGRGFIVYMYDALELEGETVWPKELTSRGELIKGDVALDLTRTESNNGDLPAGWHVLGNPYPYAISWPDMVAANDIQNLFPVMFVFDNEMNEGAGGFRMNFGFDMGIANQQNFNGVIEPFSAFQVRVLNGENQGSITFKESHAAAQNSGNTHASDPVPFLAFSVSGAGLQDMSVITLRDEAEIAMERPSPLQLPAISFGFSDETEKQFVLKNLEMQQGDERLVPLSFASIQSGTFTIDLNGYEGWGSDLEVVMIDYETGAEHNFGDQQCYSFSYEPSAENMERRNVARQMSAQQAVNQPDVLELTAQSRFGLRLTKGTTTSTEPAGDLPAEFALNQNYPNPFNPNTQIQYQLPQQSDVQLEVFNIQGQRVAVLVNGPQSAGFHSVSFDGSRLSSGVYIYRIQAGSFTESRKMTLIK